MHRHQDLPDPASTARWLTTQLACSLMAVMTRSMACATVSASSVERRMDSCRLVQGLVKAAVSIACSSSSSQAADVWACVHVRLGTVPGTGTHTERAQVINGSPSPES